MRWSKRRRVRLELLAPALEMELATPRSFALKCRLRLPSSLLLLLSHLNPKTPQLETGPAQSSANAASDSDHEPVWIDRKGRALRREKHRRKKLGADAQFEAPRQRALPSLMD